MNDLKLIWPTLGDGRASFPRNLSWTKRGPGRRHNLLTKNQQAFKDKHGIDPRHIDDWKFKADMAR